MRDGIELHTTIYQPKDTSRSFPFLMMRTCYSCRPYGEGAFPGRIGPSAILEDEGYIFVCQDVRGRWMSEGSFDNMRPHLPGDGGIDESSDTYDTIEWLLANVEGHNGKVGMWGTSYPGFYTAAAIPDAHPALVASEPRAPITDFYFDDFHHRGAYTLAYWLITPVFGYQHDGPTTEAWYEIVDPNTPDAYRFFMEMGPLKNASKYYGKDNFFWQQLVEHPDYDEFWQARNLLPHLTGVDHAVLTVGGWFDAEDLYGPLNIYQTVERENPDAWNSIIMGPWSHGAWGRDSEHAMVGNIHFGEHISAFYQREVEAPFFRHFLKGEGEPPEFEAMMFDTGKKEWTAFDRWPPMDAGEANLCLFSEERLALCPDDNGSLSWNVEHGTWNASAPAFSEYISDPNEPVPYSEDIKQTYTPRKYMTDDQRFASRRTDVIEFETEILEEDLTVAGDILARLFVSTTGTDADWVVKLVDVYPNGEPNHPQTPEGVELGGYEQMVRSEILRGRYRNGFEHPEPFLPGETTEIELPLQDVYHTFKAGHRMMVQIQSTWFPLFDRNPQTYVDNIFKADAEDFVKATHRVYHSERFPSRLEVRVME